ncbi:MAG: proline dehydrogenase [bacterium]|nr:proline dehydrogenase [bacterium]
MLDRLISATLPIVPKPVVRFFSRRYIAGPTIEDALSVVRSLRTQGALSTLDILGEFIEAPGAARENAKAYLELVQRIRAEGLTDAHISVKLSALGLLIDRQLCLDNMRELVELVAETDNFLRIDMEDSPCTTATLETYQTLRREFPGRVGVVLQSRLRRTLDDVDAQGEEPGNFRLCKGIYLEPRKIAYTDAELIRRNYTLILEQMFRRGDYVGIATHDERLVWEALRLIRQYGLTPDQYEFQMLLGVDEPLRKILIDAGHRLRVYVPFGKHWYSYSVRRLRENPQIAGYAFKAIFQRG